jgi:hypothetical protein
MFQPPDGLGAAVGHARAWKYAKTWAGQGRVSMITFSARRQPSVGDASCTCRNGSRALTAHEGSAEISAELADFGL